MTLRQAQLHLGPQALPVYTAADPARWSGAPSYPVKSWSTGTAVSERVPGQPGHALELCVSPQGHW